MTQEQLIIAACEHLKETLLKKNADYGDSFAKQFQKYGLVSARIRVEDKLNRIDNLMQQETKVVEEPSTDNWLDLSGYSLLTYIELTKEQKL